MLRASWPLCSAHVTFSFLGLCNTTHWVYSVKDNKLRRGIPVFMWPFLSAGVRLDPSHPSRLQQAGSSFSSADTQGLHQLWANHRGFSPAVFFHTDAMWYHWSEGNDTETVTHFASDCSHPALTRHLIDDDHWFSIPAGIRSFKHYLGKKCFSITSRF